MSRWPKVPLGELLQSISRPESVDPERTYRILGAHWYAGGLYIKDALTGTGIQAGRVFRVEEGDFVYNRLFAWKGSFALATRENHGCYVSNEFPCFRVRSDRLDGQYLWRYWSRSAAWDDALGLSTGGTPTSRNRLKEEAFLAMTIPLPRLAEQRRLVERIEALAAKVEEAKRLRVEAEEEAAAIEASATNSLFDPSRRPQWESRPLGDFAEIQSGVTLGRTLTGPTVRLPYLRVANVQDGHLDLRIVKEIEVKAEEHDKWQLHSGDLLLTEGGDWDKLGRGTVWRGEIPSCIHQNHIFRVRVDQRLFDPDFLALLTASPYGKQYFQVASKQTTNLASINQRQLKAFPVLRPCLEEQRQIVRSVRVLKDRVAAVLALHSETGAELAALLPAVLDRAFRGEL